MSVFRTSTRAGLMSTCLAAVLPATAAMAQDLEDEYYTLDTITIEAQDEQRGAADRGASVYAADAELERARLGDMKDVFAGMANVSVGGAIPVAQKIFVNGIDMLNLVVSMDGVLQNNRSFHHVSASVFDPGLLKFVRVDPGVAAADTGPNAVAGAVIMETKDATDIISEGETFGGEVRLGFADNGKTLNGSATVAAASNGWEVLGYVRSAKGDDYEDGSGVIATGTAADMQSGLLKLAYESDTGHRFELSGQKLFDDALRNRRANFGNSQAGLVQYDTERTNLSFNYGLTNGGGNWDPQIVLGYSDSSIFAPVSEDSNTETKTLSFKAQNTFHPSDTNTIVAGIDYYDRDAEYFSSSTRRSENAQNFGVFAQARFEPSDRWRISAGVRGDTQKFEGGDGYTDTFSGFSGNASAIFDVTNEFSLRAGYSNVFGGLQIEDGYNFWQTDPQFSQWGQWDYTGIKASRAENANIGFDFRRGGFSVGGEVFRTEVADARDGDQNFDFSSQGYNLNAGFAWDLGSARFSYSNTETKRDGNLVPSGEMIDYGAPLGEIIAFEIMQRIPQANNLIIGGSLDMALDYNPTYNGANPWPTQGLKGYEVVNLFAEYTPPSMSNWTIRGEVLNLFDEDYSDRASYGGDYPSDPSFSPIKEPGRTFVIQAIAKF